MFDNSKVVDKQAFVIYQKASGEIDRHRIVNITVGDHYLQGITLPERQFRTFNIDRIISMYGSENELDAAELPDQIKSTSTKTPKPVKSEIAFTGFSIADKQRLEQLAAAAGLTVKKDVTKNLAYLCCGSNAGPTKTSKARTNGAMALTEQQFINLIETGELPELGEYDLLMDPPASEPSNDIDAIRDIFTTWRTLPRRQCLIAQYVDGFAAGWRFCVGEAHRAALDIRYTTISTENTGVDGKKWKHTESVWTQGHAFNFIGGELICSHISGAKGPWSEFIKMVDERVISVKFSTPAGYDTVDSLEGEFTGVLRRNNASTEQGERRQEGIPLAINSQTYDEGTVTIAVSRPNGERLIEIERKTLTQVELVALLQNGSITRTVSIPDGKTAIEHYNPFMTQRLPANSVTSTELSQELSH